jgi:hypothetical protein
VKIKPTAIAKKGVILYENQIDGLYTIKTGRTKTFD